MGVRVMRDLLGMTLIVGMFMHLRINEPELKKR